MTVLITDKRMTSPDTPHYAIPVNKTSWRVTWLAYGTRLTRNQANTAMMIAAVVGNADDPDDLKSIRGHLVNWAAEIGLSVDMAVDLAARPRVWNEV